MYNQSLKVFRTKHSFSYILSLLMFMSQAFLVGQQSTSLQSDSETVTLRQVLGVIYPEGPEIETVLGGTHRLPEASGTARVTRKSGTTEIRIELSNLKPAAWFGGDLATYVAWIVSPEGHVDNVGEIILKGDEGRLANVSTTLETFGIFVSAEPHFLVERPSRFVVIENVRPEKNIGLIKFATIRYRGFDGLHNHSHESLESVDVQVQGEFQPYVRSAVSSVELAKRAGAERFAAAELSKAQEALSKTLEAAETGVSDRNLMLFSHETVRLAVDAQKTAESESFQAALNAERQASAQRIQALEHEIESAEDEAERARLEAQRKELEAELEAAAHERTRKEARAAAQRAAAAQREARAAQDQERQARQELKKALGRVAEVRETARGLIVTLPDILFEFDKASLTAQAREILAKIAGIFQVVPEFFLKVEGHTDEVGSEQYNLTLSRKRAESVMDYLVSQGISPAMITATGFGETRPIASNDTHEGRQQNRRVEVVVTETYKAVVQLD